MEIATYFVLQTIVFFELTGCIAGKHVLQLQAQPEHLARVG